MKEFKLKNPMIPLDKKIVLLKLMFETGQIKAFREIFDYIPKSTVASKLRLNYQNFTARLYSPSNFRVKELMVIGKFLEIPYPALLQLVVDEVEKRKKDTSLK